MRLLVFGQQGSGKGTQAKLLAEHLKIPHISTGDLVREEIMKDTDLGNKISSLVERGVLVPDALILELLRQRLSKPDALKGFILDGFPRNEQQQQTLDKLTQIDVALFLHIPETVATERLSARRTCRGCGKIYGKDRPPKLPGRCDACGNELYQRADDWPDAIKQRFKIFREETMPVIRAYQSQGKLVQINADQSVESVFMQIKQALKLG
ncbi:MAG: nucleoside monophosphate kinase [Nanoarchaeota archaeon]|nr:nucleoside monophosphate kinase [Nanoarchaeota archaeon]